MAFKWTETRDSQEAGTNPATLVYRYVATGTNDRAYVHAYAIAVTPNIVSGIAGVLLFKQDVQIKPNGFECWKVEVPYAEARNEVGEYDIDIDTTGGSVHITASKQTIAAFGSGSSTSDYGQLIGVTEKDDVEGADVVVPACKIVVNFRHPTGFISMPQVKNLARWTGRTNSDTFLTFAAGEVLFLGFVGKMGSNNPTTLAYHFAMSENLTGLSVGGISSISKKGHELYWIAYKSAVVGNIGRQQPRAVYVERIYDQIPMALSLGFGA